MRLNIAQILICCREAIDQQYPARLYPRYTRTAEAIKFLHGASDALRAFKRINEAGIIKDIIAGIKRDGFDHLQMKIRESENMRVQVSSKLDDN